MKKTPESTLDQSIMVIYSQTCIEDLVAETSRILKTLIPYKLFAFVLEESEGLQIWSDHLLNKLKFMDIVSRDFPLASIQSMDCISKNSDKIINAFFHQPEPVESIDFSCIGQNARLYLILSRELDDHQRYAAQMLIHAFESTLRTIIKITHLEKAITMDPLTGCYNRRALSNILDQGITNAHRYNRELSMIMMDIDHFKSINDTYGHPFGDQVLKTMSSSIQSFIRKGDSLARYGGEEFAIILPETSLILAIEITQRLKWSIQSIPFETPDGEIITITASYGISSVEPDDNSLRFVNRADRMLYKAKARGRNCIMPFLSEVSGQEVLDTNVRHSHS